MTILAFPILFAAGVLTAGCNRSARSGRDFVVRDSAGVTIVERGHDLLPRGYDSPAWDD